jgi:endoglucanase
MRTAREPGAAIAFALLPRQPGTQGPSSADGAARAFLQRYVQADGRVVRTDQGGDTVSEGQAYAMLLAAAVRDHATFDRIWAWTRTHLQRPDGLLSWHWQDGRVADTEPAADADVDAARALLIGGRVFSRSGYTAAAKRIADAVAAQETAQFGSRRLLVAGPWAVGRRMVNPSYLAPRAFADLHDLTGDNRWKDALDGSVAALRELMSGGRLPPDWATVDASGDVKASGPPADPSAPSSYGLEAPRVFLRLAESCDSHVRAMAGSAADAAEVQARNASHPAVVVGAAAAAYASGDKQSATMLLDHAQSMAERDPTYYGWALVALGRVTLQSDALGSC